MRRLIEVALPLAAMNAAGRAEKAVPRKGLPATMHLWWSRKPTGLARAVLFASVAADPARSCDADADCDCAGHAERRQVLDLVADLARWDCPPDRVDEARHVLTRQGDAPAVIDPFCGGGAIPLEAARLGLEPVAGDLNPVAALITKGLVEIPPHVGGRDAVHPQAERSPPSAPVGGLAEDVRRYGADLGAEVQRRVGTAFPVVRGAGGVDLTPVSYLWARTATCGHAPCRAELPLLSTWWLSTRPQDRWHVRPELSGDRLGFVVGRGPPPDDLPVPKTGRGGRYRCLRCGATTPATAIQRQGRARRLGLRLVAVQVLADAARRRAGRSWLAGTAEQESAALDAWPSARAFPLTEPLPGVAGNVHAYGLATIEDLLTSRQRLVMVTLCDVLAEMHPVVEADARRAGWTADGPRLRDAGRGAAAYADAVTTYLALTVSRLANRMSTMTIHNRANGSVEQSFVQPAYAFYGEFPEAFPFSGSTGSWGNALAHVADAVAALPVGPTATVRAGPALDVLAAQRGLVATDPPYYDLFDYAALSNLFYGWLRLALGDVWPDETATSLSPADAQMVSNPARFGDDPAAADDVFRSRLVDVGKAVAAVQRDDYPLVLFFGHRPRTVHVDGRSSAAWEALLTALVDNGLQVVRTWPLRTERPEGVKSGSSSLGASLLLVCRPRPEPAPKASLEQLVAELQRRLPPEVDALRASGLAPVDVAHGALGPGIALFSAFARVVDADGSPVTVRAALGAVDAALHDVLTRPDAALDAESRWALAWFEEVGRSAGPLERAQLLAAASGTSLDALTGSGIVRTAGGTARLVAGDQLDPAWSPDPGGAPPAWLVVQHLSARLATGGRAALAALAAELPADTVATARGLAARLHAVSDRRRWSGDARAFNAVASGP